MKKTAAALPADCQEKTSNRGAILFVKSVRWIRESTLCLEWLAGSSKKRTLQKTRLKLRESLRNSFFNINALSGGYSFSGNCCIKPTFGIDPIRPSPPRLFRNPLRFYAPQFRQILHHFDGRDPEHFSRSRFDLSAVVRAFIGLDPRAMPLILSLGFVDSRPTTGR